MGDPAGVGPELVREVARRMGRSYQLRLIGESVGVRVGRPTLKGARMAMEALEESVRLLRSGEIADVAFTLRPGQASGILALPSAKGPPAYYL
ncbi:MAG: hypothetical protein EBY83_08350, partial [Verrucomicrobia bacterium]|nr:hypothetical protein [Verrucomicrobiota bacterium]